MCSGVPPLRAYALLGGGYVLGRAALARIRRAPRTARESRLPSKASLRVASINRIAQAAMCIARSLARSSLSHDVVDCRMFVARRT